MFSTNLIPLILTFFSVLDTPGQADWTRKVLIGYNDSEIMYLEIKRTNPGSYFSYTDSMFTVSINPSNGIEIQRQLLRATLHEDSTSMGDWTQKELYIAPNDMNHYLSSKKIHYAFASARPWIGKLKFEEYGLLLQYEDIGRSITGVHGDDAV